MEIYLQAQTDPKILNEFADTTLMRWSGGWMRRRGGKVFLQAALVGAALFVLLTPLAVRSDLVMLAAQLCFAATAISALAYLLVLFQRAHMKRLLKKQNVQFAVLVVNEQGLVLDQNHGAQRYEFAWPMMKTVFITRNLYIFIATSDLAIFFPRAQVAGREVEFEGILTRNLPPKSIKR